MNLTPIGVLRCAATYPYDAARQAAVADEAGGIIELAAGQNFEQALTGLDGFSHVWLIYVFHHNAHWKPMVLPPRAQGKVGVFASRAPYRPNPIGLSCVALRGVDGRRVHIGPHDLLDKTPILDIKPYLPYADSVPGARTGWVDTLGEETWQVAFAPAAEAQLAWLKARGLDRLRAFLRQQLGEQPFDTARKRIRALDETQWEIAYRTWRAAYRSATDAPILTVTRVYSGYSLDELADGDDPWDDKALHREFRRLDFTSAAERRPSHGAR